MIRTPFDAVEAILRVPERALSDAVGFLLLDENDEVLVGLIVHGPPVDDLSSIAALLGSAQDAQPDVRAIIAFDFRRSEGNPRFCEQLDVWVRLMAEVADAGIRVTDVFFVDGHALVSSSGLDGDEPYGNLDDDLDGNLDDDLDDEPYGNLDDDLDDDLSGGDA